ncbi:MAG TPA: PAS domain S-box protein [Candidatus Brocadiaceae bacterium]|nr:PAS domain S-box protein [Candidatus Brocadiaceae bacterium]
MCDEKGAIIGVIGTARDITKQKQIMEALRQAKDYAEDLIETANVLIVGLDVAGNIRVFNEAAEKITGYKKTEVLGKNCFETLMPQGLSPDAWQAFHAWRTTGQITKHYESQILTKSSKTRIVSWQSSEVKDRGKVTGILSFGNDITEQKQMKSLVERLRLMSFVRDVSVALSEGAVLGDILRACAEAIVRNLDAALARIWTFNEKDKVLELQASEGISTRSDSGYSRVPIGKYREDDKRVALSGKTDEMDEKYSVGGQELIVHTMKTPIKDEAGNVIGILGIFWDITEKVTLELETLRTRHLASLGELSAGIAHEINNPLNGIINYAQILLTGFFKPYQQRAICLV